MSDKVVALRPELMLAPAPEPATLDQCSGKARDRALAREVLVEHVIAQIAGGLSKTEAISHLRLQLEHGTAAAALLRAATALGGTGSPSRSALHDWVGRYRARGVLGLVDGYKGRERRHYGWEPRALHWVHSSNGLCPGSIARVLQQEGERSATYARVLRWYKALPADVRNNRGRLGDLKYSSTQRPYTRRKPGPIKVGECYQSDGNKMPIYLAPTGSGRSPQRYELTPMLDVRSRYFVGYCIAPEEASHVTMHALTDAIVRENHVPLDVQADNGPGFKNRLIQRFYTRLGIDPEHSRARNPQDNGYVERFHQSVQNEFLRQFPGYCGAGKSKEALQRYLARVRRGEEQLMTVAEFCSHLDRWREWYNQERVHGEIGCTPASLWATLERRPPVDSDSAFFWDQEERVVQRCAIRLANREYLDPALAQYNGEKVIAAFNLYKDAYVRVLDLDERWICDARLVKPAPYRSESVMQDKRIRSVEDQRRRAQRKLDEIDRRAALTVSHERDLRFLDVPPAAAHLETGGSIEPPAAKPVSPGSPSGIELDLDDTDYL